VDVRKKVRRLWETRVDVNERVDDEVKDDSSHEEVPRSFLEYTPISCYFQQQMEECSSC